jgi:predicted ATPase
VIRRLRIRNFKAFRDQQLEFAPLTLLAGLNGSGKSSILQSLLLLRQSYNQGLLHEGRLALDGDLLRLGTFQDALFEGASQEHLALDILVDDRGRENLLSWVFDFGSKDDRVSRRIENSTASSFPDISLFGQRFCFLSAERIGPRLNYGVSDLDFAVVRFGIRGEWTAQYLAACKDEALLLQGCFHPAAVSGRLLNQVEAWMSEFSPGLRIEAETDPERDSVRLRYRFEAQRGVSNSYRATNVGFGISYTLPVVVAVLASHPGDLILLEAPEAHLHPRGQSKLGELLARAASNGVQIIVETHSDHVMNGVRVAVHEGLISAETAQFLYFQWDPKKEDGATGVERIVMDDHGRVENWPPGFFDEMDRNLEILLAEKPVSQ